MDGPGTNAVKKWKWFAVLAILVTAVAIGYAILSERLSLETLASHERQLRDLHERQPLITFGAAFFVYVVITALPVPGAAALTLAYGWFFRFVPAVILVSFASTTGAALAFLFGRYLFHDAMQRRFGDRLKRFNEAWRRDGAFFLFTLRLTPLVPFFIINPALGMTPIRARTFWWVSQLGMLPATIVYVYAGSSVPSLHALAEQGVAAAISTGQWIRLVIALALLGVFPLAVRWTLRYFGMAAPLQAKQATTKGSAK